MTDPIHTYTAILALAGGAESFLAQLRIRALAAGWVIDEWDTTPTIGTSTGGAELYLRTQKTGFSEQGSFSLKAFLGSNADQTGIFVCANTAYNGLLRFDNQPGMFARKNNDITNGVSWAQIFAGQWDNGGINANFGDPGLYQTAPPGAGSPPVPSLISSVPHLNFPRASAIDKLWFFNDIVGAGGSRTLTAVWYVGAQLYMVALGKVHYDNEGAAPDNVDGSLLACLHNKFDDRNTLLLPANNSLGCQVSDAAASAVNAPLALIRQRTNGGVTWPAGTPTGAPLALAGPVVKSNDHLEASDGNVNDLNRSMVIRPDQNFDSLAANLSDLRFPNPRLSVHRETFGAQQRLGFARARGISRYPNGGTMLGINGAQAGVTDWSDARWALPWYSACTLGAAEGDIVSNGSRQYMLFPGNRGGIDPLASHRRAGIAFRIA